jgi:hypothetical protein
MTASPTPPARKPAHAPSRADLDERDRFARLTARSMETVQGAARAWRTGLAAFITLVTTGVIIKGPGTTAELAFGWRTAITALIGGGLLLAVVGLWLTLAAEAGTDPKKQTLQDIRATHGTLTDYQVYLAAKSADRLQWGRRVVAIAVLLLLAGIGVTWWAPAATTSMTCNVVESIGTSSPRPLCLAGGYEFPLTVKGKRCPAALGTPPRSSVTFTCLQGRASRPASMARCPPRGVAAST